jgi:hypothetical protein
MRYLILLLLLYLVVCANSLSEECFHRVGQGVLGMSLATTAPQCETDHRVEWLVSIRVSYSEDTRSKYRPECRLPVLVFRDFPRSPQANGGMTL